MVIHSEVLVTPDFPTIKFRQPREQVNLSAELPRVLNAQGWGCGTYFNVQFLSHDKTKLLASALFVVSEESESVHTSDNQYNPVTKTVFSRKCEQISDWWLPPEGLVSPASPDGKIVSPMSNGKSTLDNQAGLMTKDGKITEVDIAHPTMVETGEPKRRGRPPKAATA